MKKIVAASFVLAGLIGCTSPSDNYCLKAAECMGEEDPAAYCQEAKDDRSAKEQECADACKAEGDAWATCYMENAECKDEVYGDLDTLEACEAEGEAVAKCSEDNCE